MNKPAPVHNMKFPNLSDLRIGVIAGSGEADNSVPGSVLGRLNEASDLQPAELLEVSAEFDADFYLRIYRDVRSSGMDPYQHYLKHGKAEGRIAKMPPILGSWDSLEFDLDTVLVVSHEGSRTGAPVLSANLVSQFKKK